MSRFHSQPLPFNKSLSAVYLLPYIADLWTIFYTHTRTHTHCAQFIRLYQNIRSRLVSSPKRIFAGLSTCSALHTTGKSHESVAEPPLGRAKTTLTHLPIYKPNPYAPLHFNNSTVLLLYAWMEVIPIQRSIYSAMAALNFPNPHPTVNPIKERAYWRHLETHFLRRNFP